MRSPVLHPTTSSESQSWLARVRENFRQLLTPTGLSPSSSNGAPIHLLKLEAGRQSRAQTMSLIAHAAILLALVLLAAQTKAIKPLAGALVKVAHDGLRFTPPPS